MSQFKVFQYKTIKGGKRFGCIWRRKHVETFRTLEDARAFTENKSNFYIEIPVEVAA